MKTAYFGRALALGLLVLAAGCKKDDPNTGSISYEKLGEVQVNYLSGFAANGDPLGLSSSGEALRWRSASRQWERVGTNTASLSGWAGAVAEDAGGNFYGASSANGSYMLPAGSSTWQALSLPDPDPEIKWPDTPLVDGSGAVVLQTRRQTSTGVRERIYRKNAGATTWTRLHDRPADNLLLQLLADNGNIYLYNSVQNPPELYVLRPGATSLVSVIDCMGTLVLPYCKFSAGYSPAGDVVLYQGGTGSKQMYRIDAGVAYPTTARELYNLPDEIIGFQQFVVLSNGTTLGVGNRGGYDPMQFHIRRAGAGAWQHAPDLPGQGYIYVLANRQGQLFTASRQSAGAEGDVYQIKF
ncbi:MAG: hypothetical protein M3Y54_19730 [Bacteroidota bacterium]|nr:hypothetical protein [Bacteroidota bacterium]